MEHPRVVVLGGGMAGRLVQHRIPHATILDAAKPPRRSGQPNRDFGAQYLWKPLDGIQCRKFTVVTHVDYSKATADSITRYKEKVGKTSDQVHWDAQFRPIMDGYSIDETISSKVQYDCRAVQIFANEKKILLLNGSTVPYDHLVSTIPLLALITLVYGTPPSAKMFRFRPIYVNVRPRPPEAPYPKSVWYVNYISDPDIGIYRFTDRGDARHYETLVEKEFPIPTRRITPGKIYPHSEVGKYLSELSKYGIVCFGRYATWDPEELLHETYRNFLTWGTNHGLI